MDDSFSHGRYSHAINHAPPRARPFGSRTRRSPSIWDLGLSASARQSLTVRAALLSLDCVAGFFLGVVISPYIVVAAAKADWGTETSSPEQGNLCCHSIECQKDSAPSKQKSHSEIPWVKKSLKSKGKGFATIYLNRSTKESNLRFQVPEIVRRTNQSADG
jgi:hypothetical protein